MAAAALESASGAPDVAAHVLLEHRSLLASTFAGPQAEEPSVGPPPGLTEAVVEANPDLAGMEQALQHQLARLRQGGRLRPTPWETLTPAERAEAFQAVLQDVVRRLDERT
mmetsp:Transcript_74233/g.240076  ORF Transcript_74233/g.240076 Transcript_74233/m.240076 type:complete len:111 (+) Transcript_74233:142-474(+)